MSSDSIEKPALTSDDYEPNAVLYPPDHDIIDFQNFHHAVGPAYTALYRKYLWSISINLALLIIILPATLLGYALVWDAGRKVGLGQGHLTNTVYSPATGNIGRSFPTPTIIPRDEANMPPRRCVTGFTAKELDLAFENIQRNHGYKGRVWNAPCDQIAMVDYNVKRMKAEYDYVV